MVHCTVNLSLAGMSVPSSKLSEGAGAFAAHVSRLDQRVRIMYYHSLHHLWWVRLSTAEIIVGRVAARLRPQGLATGKIG